MAFTIVGAVLTGGISAAVLIHMHGSSPTASTRVLGEQTSKPGGAGNASHGKGHGNGLGTVDTPDNPGHPISVTWSVDRLLKPGTPATLNALITNTNSQDILVTSVNAVVTAVDKPNCDAAWVTIDNYADTLGTTILKNSAGTIGLPITLRDLPETNQDACKNAAFTIAITAEARQA